jgi:hypothetical protein
VTGVGAGNLATCDLPIGNRYHQLIIEATATGGGGITLTLADVLAELRVMVNGKVFRDILATELDTIQTKYGSDYASQAFNSTGSGNTLAAVYSGGNVQAPQAASQTTFMIAINFSEPWRKSYSAREARALPTAWANGAALKSFQLLINCPATGNIASGYTIRVHSISDTMLGSVDATSKLPITLACKWYRQQLPYTASGDLPTINLIKPTPGTLAIVEEHTFLMPGTDTINRVVVTADGRQVRDVVKVTNDFTLLLNGYNPLLNNGNKFRFDLDYDYSDLPTDGLALSTPTSAVGTYKITTTITAASANNATVISQVYGPLD